MKKNGADKVEQLIIRVKSGDSTAYNDLLTQYLPLIKKLVTYYSTMSDSTVNTVRQDMEQEASLALYNAAVAYDFEKRGVTFGLFARICIKNALISMLRKMKKEPKSVEIDTDNQAQLRFYPQGSAKLLGNIEAEEYLERIGGLLSKYENVVFCEYISGKKAREIAQKLGKSDKSVSNALCRIKVKIKSMP